MAGRAPRAPFQSQQRERPSTPFFQSLIAFMVVLNDGARPCAAITAAAEMKMLPRDVFYGAVGET